MKLVYFSAASENTHRFVLKLQTNGTWFDAIRLPMGRNAPAPLITDPYILLVPTYGCGNPRTAVPRPVARFLNIEANRALLRGVISSGNTNFGSSYCMAGRMIADKCAVPHLDSFELLGTQEDVSRIRERLLTA